MINLDSKSSQAKLGLLGLKINVKLRYSVVLLYLISYTCERHCLAIILGAIREWKLYQSLCYDITSFIELGVY